MTAEEQQIVNGLLIGDNRIIRKFFYTQCRPMFYGLMRKIFKNNADYKELVNEVFYLILKNDGAILRTFRGDPEGREESIYGWLKTVSSRYFWEKVKRKHADHWVEVHDENGEVVDPDPIDEGNEHPGITMDAAHYLGLLDLQGRERERIVLEKFYLEDMPEEDIAEALGVTIDNVYTIKSRALKRLQRTARISTSAESLCAIIAEQYAMDCFEIHRSLERLRDIALEKGWLEDTGMALQNLGRLCALHGLTVNSGKCDVHSLVKAIDAGNPVIAIVDGGELTGNPLEERIEDAVVGGVADHCVVILDIDEPGKKVVLYDPEYGTTPLTMSLDHFMGAWDDSGQYALIISK